MKEREESAEGSEREGFEETNIVRLEQDMVVFLHLLFLLELALCRKVAMEGKKRKCGNGYWFVSRDFLFFLFFLNLISISLLMLAFVGGVGEWNEMRGGGKE